MKTSHSLVRLIIFFALLAFAGSVSADEMSDLKDSFKKRYSQLQAQIAAGKVGETTAGTVEAVNAGDAAVAGIVSAENADRAKLYAALAARESITADVVAKRNAMRNFAKAKVGEWLKGKDGWKQKK